MMRLTIHVLSKIAIDTLIVPILARKVRIIRVSIIVGVAVRVIGCVSRLTMRLLLHMLPLLLLRSRATGMLAA